MSVRASISPPSNCSGAMYWNVPRMAPAAVSDRCSVGKADSVEMFGVAAVVPASFARPQSQSLALEVLHDQEVHVPFPTDVMEGADVGMVEAGDGARLSLEALSKVRIAREMRGKHLDGYRTVEARVLGQVDLAP